MNSQEYRNLSEAYLNVYQELDEATRELDEVRGGGKIDAVSDIPSIGERGSRSPKDAGMLMSPLDRATARANALRKRKNPEATKRANRIDSRFVNPTNSAVNRSLLAATNARHAEKTRLMNPQESYDPDLFDVILEYLMTEGYADTNENALVIMANMSEDWRESILSESLSIDRGIRFREIDKKNRREGKPRAADGDTRNQQFDTTSFGKGNKATRRQGYNVTDTSTWPDQEGRRSEHDANRGVKRKKSGNVNYQQQPK